MFDTIFEIAQVTLTDFQGNSHLLSVDETNCNEDQWFFCDETKRMKAGVALTQGNGQTACRIWCDITTKVVYDQRLTLAEMGSIKLFLRPKGNKCSVVGSYFELPEKNDAWCSVFWTDALKRLPERTASVLWKDETYYYHMIPLCDGDFKSEISGCKDWIEISVSPYTGGFTKVDAMSFVISRNKDPYQVIEQNIEQGFSALGLKRAMRKDKRLPDLFRYLGWCSWDAFYTDVNSKGILEKAKEFQEKKIPVKWHLIDDGWFQYQDRMLLDFKEDPKKFPEGLAVLIDRLKTQFGVKWVGAWQCFLGCWAGIHPEGNVAKNYQQLVYQTNSGTIVPSPNLGNCFAFWNTWNTYLRNQGIDFVKVDVQSSLEAYIHGNMSVGKAAKQSHYALDASAAMNYDGAIINCTGMGTESIWNRPSSPVNRNSGDFIPSKPESMREFVAKNVYNSLYHSQLYYTDWDMMWSAGPTAKINTVLHAISGGPVYVSDPVGQSDPDVLIPFAKADGELLQCDQLAMPTTDVLFEDVLENQIMLKAWNRSLDAGVIAAFNTYQKGGEVSGTISPKDVPGLKGKQFAVYDWFAGKIWIQDSSARTEVRIPENEAKLFLLAPFVNGICTLGLLEKYIPTAAIREKRIFEDRTKVVLKCGGTFAYFCEDRHQVKINGKLVQPEKKEDYYCIECPACSEEIEVEIIQIS